MRTMRTECAHRVIVPEEQRGCGALQQRGEHPPMCCAVHLSLSRGVGWGMLRCWCCGRSPRC
eukprot:1153936-Pelagomonas_calceolata.AAC.7